MPRSQSGRRHAAIPHWDSHARRACLPAITMYGRGDYLILAAARRDGAGDGSLDDGLGNTLVEQAAESFAAVAPDTTEPRRQC